jgi:hypothetical protein
MLLFKVKFTNNKAVMAEFAATPRRAVEWKENPYSIIAIEVYASNNLQALELAQVKADILLKAHQ